MVPRPLSQNITNANGVEGKDLTIAVNELRGFLVQSRTRIQKFLNFDGSLKDPLQTSTSTLNDQGKPPFHTFIPNSGSEEPIDWAEKLREVARLVDTVLFRAYMMTSPSLAGPLFRLDNFCDPQVVKEKLYESGRYVDLIDFLHGKKLHKEALELLKKFGQNQADDEVLPALQGPQRTVVYLQQLQPELIDIIIQYAEWPMQADSKLGMEIFLADTENAETLPRHQVLDFLQQHNTKFAIKYLEHIIKEWNDQTPEFHQKLIDLYITRLKAPADGQATDESTDETERLTWKTRLEDFLRTSNQYTWKVVFSRLPRDGNGNISVWLIIC